MAQMLRGSDWQQKCTQRPRNLCLSVCNISKHDQWVIVHQSAQLCSTLLEATTGYRRRFCALADSTGEKRLVWGDYDTDMQQPDMLADFSQNLLKKRKDSLEIILI